MTGSEALMTCVKNTEPSPIEATWLMWPLACNNEIGRKLSNSALFTCGGSVVWYGMVWCGVVRCVVLWRCVVCCGVD